MSDIPAAQLQAQIQNQLREHGQRAFEDGMQKGALFYIRKYIDHFGSHPVEVAQGAGVAITALRTIWDHMQEHEPDLDFIRGELVQARVALLQMEGKMACPRCGLETVSQVMPDLSSLVPPSPGEEKAISLHYRCTSCGKSWEVSS